jgi:uncharacterized integral membrane protein
MWVGVGGEKARLRIFVQVEWKTFCHMGASLCVPVCGKPIYLATAETVARCATIDGTVAAAVASVVTTAAVRGYDALGGNVALLVGLTTLGVGGVAFVGLFRCLRRVEWRRVQLECAALQERGLTESQIIDHFEDARIARNRDRAIVTAARIVAARDP